MSKFDSYLICTSPRSGSTLLCQLLANTGIAGHPESYFHRPSVSAWANRFNLTIDNSMSDQELINAVFHSAIATGTKHPDMFGLRMQRPSFDYFMQQVSKVSGHRSADIDKIQSVFGRTAIIHLSRQDKLHQAISLVKAKQTGLWHMAANGRELERLTPPQAPVYSTALIREQIAELTEYDNQWINWFEQENIEPLHVSYEALSANAIEVLHDILDFLHINRDNLKAVEPTVAKMSDQTNRDWARQYRSEHTEI